MNVGEALTIGHRFDVDVVVTSRDRVLVQVPLGELPEEAETAVRVLLAAAPATLRRLLATQNNLSPLVVGCSAEFIDPGASADGGRGFSLAGDTK